MKFWIIILNFHDILRFFKDKKNVVNAGNFTLYKAKQRKQVDKTLRFFSMKCTLNIQAYKNLR